MASIFPSKKCKDCNKQKNNITSKKITNFGSCFQKCYMNLKLNGSCWKLSIHFSKLNYMLGVTSFSTGGLNLPIFRLLPFSLLPLHTILKNRVKQVWKLIPLPQKKRFGYAHPSSITACCTKNLTPSMLDWTVKTFNLQIVRPSKKIALLLLQRNCRKESSQPQKCQKKIQ